MPTNLAGAFRSGVEIGTATGGGRFSGIGQAIKGIADRLKAKREAGEEFITKKALLREAEKVKAEFREPKERDFKKDILGLISGIRPAEDILTPEQITQVAPLALGGRPGGGRVLTPPGATFRDGTILSAAGERIGEFTPGREPERFTPVIGEQVGRELGITPREAGRGFLGLPKAEKPTGRITPSVAINILSDPFKSREFRKEFGDEAFEELKAIATGGIGKTSFIKGREPDINLMDTNF